MRYLTSLFLALAVLTGISTGASAAESTSTMKLTIDGEVQRYTQGPIMIEGRAVVPMRQIFERLGATIGWNQVNQSVLVTTGEKQIELKIGSKTAKVNGADVVMDIEPLLINEMTMVSVRFVAEVTGTDLLWNQAEQRIEISTRDAKTNPSAVNSQKIVAIETETADGTRHTGHAIAIEDQLFVTTAELLTEATSARLIAEDGTSYSVEGVVLKNNDLGLAIVKTVEPTPIEAVKHASAQFTKRDDAVSILLTGEASVEVVDGEVGAFHEQQGTDTLEVVADLPENRAGAAVYNEQGEVIGILTGQQKGAGHLAVAMDELDSWLTTELTEEAAKAPTTFPALQAQAVDATTLASVQSELNGQHAALRTAVGEMKLTPWEVRLTEGQVLITARIDPNQYLHYVKHYAKIKPQLTEQLQSIGELLAEQLPGQRISLQVVYVKDFDFKPKSFAADEWQQQDGKWSVRHLILGLDMGATAEPKQLIEP